MKEYRLLVSIETVEDGKVIDISDSFEIARSKGLSEIEELYDATAENYEGMLGRAGK